MLTLNLQPIFKARGIDKPYSYLVNAGVAPYTAHNLINGKSSSIRFSHIEKLCSVLHCTPQDLFLWTPDKGESLSPDHPLNALKRRETGFNWDKIKTIPLDQLEQIAKIINGNKK